jgi:hypothetical protein
MKGLLALVKAVAEAPQLGAVDLDGDEQAVAVGEVVRLRRGLGVRDCDMREHRVASQLGRDAQQQQKEQQNVAAVAGCRWMCPVWLPVSLEQKG